MSDMLRGNERMKELLLQLTPGDGIHHSTVTDGLRYMRSSVTRPRTQVMYEPSFVFMASGRKRGYLEDQEFIYDKDNFLILTVPMPFECETFAEDNAPLLGVKILVDMTVLNELLMKIDPRLLSKPAVADRGVHSSRMTARLTDSIVRLLECQTNPIEGRVLGPQILREITFLVLSGENGGALRELMAVNGKMGQIQRAIQKMHVEFEKPLDIQTLADEAGISSSAFHHNFKALTSTSPLQYLKTIRLHKAKMLMLNEGITAGAASERVGYESASQFSREFKRFFGSSPVQEIAKMREQLGLQQPELAAVD